MASTRRSLLKKVAAAPALLGLLRQARRAEAAEPTPTPTVAAAPVPTPAPTPVPKPSQLQLLARERYGKYLTEEQGAQLDERMAGLERTSARLRAIKFANREEPTTDFHVLRSRAVAKAAMARRRLGGGGKDNK